MAVTELIAVVGARRACELTGRSRASHYRVELGPVLGPPAPRPSPPNKLSVAEFDAVLDLLHSERFVDLAPAQIWAILLDSGRYVASISTMYRVLRSQDEVRERRRQATHPPRVRPELVARGPNEVWSWDITKLKGPSKGVWFDLYVIIDIFSRYVVGWMVAPTETAELAKAFIAATIEGQGITAEVLTIHADRGTSMTSKPVAVLLAELGVTRTHSRPHVSNDNPYSEAINKTLKYCPAFPDRFGSIEDARAFCVEFFAYYNTTIIATAASPCTPPPPCMTGPPAPSRPNGRPPSPPPTPPTRSGSPTASPACPRWPPSHGSTSPPSPTTPRRHRDPHGVGATASRSLDTTLLLRRGTPPGSAPRLRTGGYRGLRADRAVRQLR